MKRASLVLVGCHMVRLISGFVSSIVLARSLGNAGFGVYAATLSLVALVTGFAEFGLTSAHVLVAARHPRRIPALTFVTGTLLSVFGLGGALAVLGLSFWASHSGTYAATSAAMLAYLAPVLMQAGNLFYSNMAAKGDSATPAVIGTSIGLAGAITRVAAVLAGADVSQVVILMSLETLAGALLGWVQLLRAGGQWPSLHRFIIMGRLLMRWAVKNLTLAQTESLFFKVETIVLVGIGLAAAAGELAVALRFYDMTLLLVAYLMTPVSAALARLSMIKESSLMQDYQSRALGMLGVVGIGLALVNLIVSPVAIHLLYGAGFHNSAAISMLLSLGLLPAVLYTFNWRAALVLGGAKRNMRGLLLLAAVKGAVVALFASRGQAWLAAATFCAGNWLAWAITAFANRDLPQLARMQGAGLWHWVTCHEGRGRLKVWIKASLRSGDLFGTQAWDPIEHRT